MLETIVNMDAKKGVSRIRLTPHSDGVIIALEVFLNDKLEWKAENIFLGKNSTVMLAHTLKKFDLTIHEFKQPTTETKGKKLILTATENGLEMCIRDPDRAIPIRITFTSNDAHFIGYILEAYSK